MRAGERLTCVFGIITMVRAVLFDLGDTLIDFEPMDTRAIFRSAARDSHKFLLARGGALPPFEQYCKSQFASIRWAYFWAKLRGREFNSLRLLEQYCARLGLALAPVDLAELAWIWYAPVTRHAGIEDDLPETLAALVSAGLALGIVSNTFVPGVVIDRHLDALGLRDFFVARLYSSEAVYRKPDRRIFDLALKQLGVVPAETMFVAGGRYQFEAAVEQLTLLWANALGIDTKARSATGRKAKTA